MVNRTWLGGGNNNASNAKDWSPKGLPQPGDTLTLPVFSGVTSETINVQGDDLRGDSFMIVRYMPALIANLSHQATMSIEVGYGGGGTFNMSQNSTLNLSDDLGGATINISGKNTLHLTGASSPSINLMQNAIWTGTFNLHSIRRNASTGSIFNNDGVSYVASGGPGYHGLVTLNVTVTGNGSFDVGSGQSEIIFDGTTLLQPTSLEFMKSVGAHQSITDRGLVKIDQPSTFAGSITLQDANPNEIPYGTVLPSEIDLVGLAKADGYSYAHDLLRIYNGKTIIETLNLKDNTTNGFEVEKISGGVNIVAFTDASHTIIGTALPIHH